MSLLKQSSSFQKAISIDCINDKPFLLYKNYETCYKDKLTLCIKHQNWLNFIKVLFDPTFWK